MWRKGGSALTFSHSALPVQKGNMGPREGEATPLAPCRVGLEPMSFCSKNSAVNMGHLLGVICVWPPGGGHHELLPAV